MIAIAMLIAAADPRMCTVKAPFKTAAGADVAKKAKVTLVSVGDGTVELTLADGTSATAPSAAVEKACGAKAVKGLPPPAEEGRMAMRVSKKTELPAGQKAGQPEPPPQEEPRASMRVSKATDVPTTPAPAATAPAADAKPQASPPTAAMAPTTPSPSTQAPAAPAPKLRKKSKDGREQIKIAIMDLKTSEQVPKELRNALTALITQTLDELGPFKAISKQDIEQMLALEAMKDSLGCNEMSCLAEIGGALGADYLIAGSVVLVGDTYLTQLQMLNIKTQRAEQRVSREYKGGPQGLLDEMRVASKIVVRDLLASRSGTLTLRCTEEGATVRVDGSIVGTTPMKTLSLAGGPHSISVEREQFVRFSQDFMVEENQETKVTATLLPSEDYKKAYRGKAMTTRILGISLTAGGGAFIAAGIAMLVVNQGNEASLKTDAAAFNAGPERTQTDFGTLQSRQNTVNVLDALTITSAIVGLGAAATGIALIVTGDNPDKYSDPKLDVKVSLRLAPSRVAMQLDF